MIFWKICGTWSLQSE